MSFKSCFCFNNICQFLCCVWKLKIRVCLAWAGWEGGPDSSQGLSCSRPQGRGAGAQCWLPHHKLNRGACESGSGQGPVIPHTSLKGFLWASSSPSCWAVPQCIFNAFRQLLNRTTWICMWYAEHINCISFFPHFLFFLLLCTYVLKMLSIHQRDNSYSELYMIPRDWQTFLLQYVYTKQK